MRRNADAYARLRKAGATAHVAPVAATERHEPSKPSWPVQAVRDALARLESSVFLRRAPTHVRLLRYLVQKRLEGDTAALRETSIAIDVFHRDPAHYDPQTDPIVRVTASRLRERIAAHHAAASARTDPRIMLPKGGYSIEFVVDDVVAPAATGIAVLRTRNHTGDASHDGYCDALADRLGDHLTLAGMPRVIARASVDAAERDLASLPDIGQRLGVPMLIESVLTCASDDRLRLTLRLVQATDGSVLWAETASRRTADRYALADRTIDAAVLRLCEILPGRMGRSTRESVRTPAIDPASLDTIRLLLLQRSLAETERAVALAETLVEQQPGAAAGWSALAAACYGRLSFRDQPVAPWAERCRDCVERALALEPDAPEALRTKAMIVGKYDAQPAAAEALFRRVLLDLPNYTSARLNYAELLALQGKFDEAFSESNLALIYDPLSPSVRMWRAMYRGYERHHNEARQEWALCRASGENSLWVLTGMGMNEAWAGDYVAAERLLAEARVRFPSLPSPQLAQACLAALRGEPGLAREIEQALLQQFDHVSSVERASLAALLGERDAALDHLRTAREERDFQLLTVLIEPSFERMADDVEFGRLLESWGTPGWRGRRVAAAPGLDERRVAG